MRTFQRALLALSFVLLCNNVGRAQSNETFSAGAGGAYDASVCNDPKIAVNAAAQKATPYHDATPTGQPDPLLAALSYLGQKDGLPYLNQASVCLHAPGVVFMVPNNLVGQVTTLVGEIEASEPGGANNNGSGGTPSSGQPGGTNGTNKNGQPIAGGTNGVNGTPGSGNNNGGPANNRGGPGPIPGPAGVNGYTPGANPCMPLGHNYDYCNNGPGAWVPPGCHCDGPPPPPTLRGGVSVTQPPTKNPNQATVDQLKYTAGFVNGVGDCIQAYVNLVAAAGWVTRGLARFQFNATSAQLNPYSQTSLSSLTAGDDFANAAKLLGLQPGQSTTLRQIATEAGAPKIGVVQDVDPYDAATSAGRRLCVAIQRGIANGMQGVKTPPNATTPGGTPSGPLSIPPARAPGGTPGAPASGPPAIGPARTPGSLPENTPGTLPAGTPGTLPARVPSGQPSVSMGGTSPSNPISGPALVGAVSNGPGGLVGTYVGTPGGPLELGTFMGKGTFGAVFQLAKNLPNVIKIPTDTPGSPQSLVNQVTGSNRLKQIGVDTPNIIQSIPAAGGQPPMLIMNNAFDKPGAFQLTTKGYMKTQATIDANNAGSGGGMQKASGAVLQQATDAVHKLYTDIGKGGYIAPDLSPGNVIFYPKPGGGLIAGVVDSDMIMTKGELLQALGGKTGREWMANPGGMSTPAVVIVSTLDSGDRLDALETTNFTTESMMNDIWEARQNVVDAAQAK